MSLEAELSKAIAHELAQRCEGALRDELQKIRQEVILLREALGAKDRPILTVGEAAAYIGVSRSKMNDLIRTGEVKSTRHAGLRRIRREWLDELFQLQSVPGARMTERLLKASGQ